MGGGKYSVSTDSNLESRASEHMVLFQNIILLQF